MIYKKRIKELLEENATTQKAMAERAGINEVTLSRYLSGDRQPKLSSICKIADVFGVSVDYLLGRENHTGATLATLMDDEERARLIHEIDELSNLLEAAETKLRLIHDITNLK